MRQPDRFATQVRANDGVGRGAVITLTKDKIQGPLNDGKPNREVGRVGDIEEHPRFRKRLLRATQTFLNGGGTADERACNLASAKTPYELQHEHHLRRLRKPRMTAREHHAELVVLDAYRIEDLVDRIGQSPLRLQQSSQVGRKSQGRTFASHQVDGAILRGLHEPRGWVFGNTAELPNLQRSAEGVLDDVFCQREIMQAKCPREGGDHTSRFAAEEMVA